MKSLTHRLLMEVKLSDILQGGPLWPSYIIGQLSGSVFNAGKKGSTNCFKRFCWTVPYLTAVILCQISLHPKDSVVFNTNAKNAKIEDFWISSIISTEVNFKVL